MPKKTKAVRLKEARLKSGLTLRALAKIVGVSFSSLARMERGQGKPSAASVMRVEKWLEDGSSSEPALRGDLPWAKKLELRVLHLEGIVTGMLSDMGK